MRDNLPITLLLFFTLAHPKTILKTDENLARNAFDWEHGAQEQIAIFESYPETRTRTVTETQTSFEIVETVYMMKLQPTSTCAAMPQAFYETMIEATTEPSPKEACEQQYESVSNDPKCSSIRKSET